MSGCHERARTEIEIMWTNQHGTGPKTDDRVETQVILQYMCQPYPDQMFTDVNKQLDFDDYEYHTIRNGKNQHAQSYSSSTEAENAHVNKEYGLHEPYHYYVAYRRRQRNKGESSNLFSTP